jgi:hypothetical protein
MKVRLALLIYDVLGLAREQHLLPIEKKTSSNGEYQYHFSSYENHCSSLPCCQNTKPPNGHLHFVTYNDSTFNCGAAVKKEHENSAKTLVHLADIHTSNGEGMYFSKFVLK